MKEKKKIQEKEREIHDFESEKEGEKREEIATERETEAHDGEKGFNDLIHACLDAHIEVLTITLITRIKRITRINRINRLTVGATIVISY